MVEFITKAKPPVSGGLFLKIKDKRMMTREKKVGQALLILALFVMITLILDNRYLAMVVNVLVMVVTVVSGIILISGDKEQ